uniref:Uncharacterized protein n=1 Tax=Rhipicephalus zambeziensis TaxID=60191 RepID=A0A224YCE1_9ACAR
MCVTDSGAPEQWTLAKSRSIAQRTFMKRKENVTLLNYTNVQQCQQCQNYPPTKQLIILILVCSSLIPTNMSDHPYLGFLVTWYIAKVHSIAQCTSLRLYTSRTSYCWPDCYAC